MIRVAILALLVSGCSGTGGMNNLPVYGPDIPQKPTVTKRITVPCSFEKRRCWVINHYTVRYNFR